MFEKARSVRLLLIAIIFGICTFATTGESALAETKPRIQLLESFLGDDRGIVYTLTDLRKGDTVYAYMTGTSGNLLVFVAFNFTISNDLPRLGYLTLLDGLIITSFCCAALVVFISVCQKRLEAKGKLGVASYIDKTVLIFYPLVYMSLVTVAYYIVSSKT